MKKNSLDELGPSETVDPDNLPRLPKVKRGVCSFCSLTHHTTRQQTDGTKICILCEYADRVRYESFRLREAVEELRSRCLCAYCGEPASDSEHVIPRRANLPTYTVPACKECNVLVGARMFESFEAKHEAIRVAIRKRYKRVLSIPEWDEEELSEMGYNMRHSIQVVQNLKWLVLQRLEWSWLDVLLNRES